MEDFMQMLTVGNASFIVACIGFMYGVQMYINHIVSYVAQHLPRRPLTFWGHMVPMTFSYIMAFLFIW